MSVSSLYGSRCGLILSSEERGSAVTSACWHCTIVQYNECWQCTIVHYRGFKTLASSEFELTPFKLSVSASSHVQVTSDALTDRPDPLSLCSGIVTTDRGLGPLVRTSGDLLGGRA